MRSVVLGKVVDNYYKLVSNTKTVNQNGEDVTVFEKKPEMIKEEKIREWKEICSFKGEPVWSYDYNNVWFSLKTSKNLNISENEEVAITQQKFRADLGELHLYSNKILEEIDVNKETIEALYEKLLGDFNFAMNTSDEKMKSYCELHGLDMRKADCKKVFKLVYPSRDFTIVDGKMVVGMIGTYPLKAGDALPVCHGSVLSGYVSTPVSAITAASSHNHTII